MLRKIVPAVVIALAATLPASAYIGPGAGAGALAIVLGVLASIALAIVALVWYPFKRLVRRLWPASRPEQTGSGKP